MADMGRPPTPQEAFLDRYAASQRIFGTGLDTSVALPCPFCAAPDFIVARVIDVKDALGRGATCEECGRSSKAVYPRTPPGEVKFEIVQTGGPPQPDWLPRRARVVPGN